MFGTGLGAGAARAKIILNGANTPELIAME